jgi:phage gp36-like protein
MPYLTREELEARYGAEHVSELLDSGSGLTFEAAEADAAAVIDSYLASVPARGYAVPLVVSPLPNRVRELSTDLTIYKLYSRGAPEDIRARHDAAIKFLEKVAKGELTIIGLDPVDPDVPITGADAVQYASEPRVFTTDTLQGFLGC